MSTGGKYYHACRHGLFIKLNKKYDNGGADKERTCQPDRIFRIAV